LNHPVSINPFEKTISTVKDYSRSYVFALWIGKFVAGWIGVYVLRREIFSFHGAVSVDLTLFEALQGEENNLEPWLSATGRFTFASVRWASMSVSIVSSFSSCQ